MNNQLIQYCRNFYLGVDKIQKLSHGFCQPLGITVFAYVRTFPNGQVSWLTSNPDQDRFLIECRALDEDPLIDTPDVLQEGMYLWFHDRYFSGCERFYKERARLFQMDHGAVLVKNQGSYLETCCFSGLLSKQPLYNLFLNEKEIFESFMKHFTSNLDNKTLTLLEETIPLSLLKKNYGKPKKPLVEDRQFLLTQCGWNNLSVLSKREKECLKLLKEGNTHQDIGKQLHISYRTVEHYIESVKNKLGIDSRLELFQAAEKLMQFKI